MPRKPKFTEDQMAFIKANADEGGVWLAARLNVTPAAMYQWGKDNEVSMKRHWSYTKIKGKTCSKWPKGYRRYKAFLVERDGLRCHYCDAMMTYNEAQIDHIVPQMRGGTDAPSNLVLACSRCNNLKGSACYNCPEFRNAVNG